MSGAAAGEVYQRPRNASSPCYAMVRAGGRLTAAGPGGCRSGPPERVDFIVELSIV